MRSDIMNIHEFRKMIDDIADTLPEYSGKEVTVMCEINDNRVFGSHPSTRVTGIIQGFDWDSWQIMLRTENKLVMRENK